MEAGDQYQMAPHTTHPHMSGYPHLSPTKEQRTFANTSSYHSGPYEKEDRAYDSDVYDNYDSRDDTVPLHSDTHFAASQRKFPMIRNTYQTHIGENTSLYSSRAPLHSDRHASHSNSIMDGQLAHMPPSPSPRTPSELQMYSDRAG